MTGTSFTPKAGISFYGGTDAKINEIRHICRRFVDVLSKTVDV